MTTDKIIAAAREAGFESESWPGGETVVSPAPAGSSITDELARFYAIAYRAGMERAAEIAFASDHMHSVNLKLAKNRIGNAIRAEAHAKNQPESTHDTGNEENEGN